MILEIKNITKKFGRKTVIKKFNLSLERGERIAISSPSGSGKTTLLRIIAGLEKHYDGEVKLGGKVSLMFQEDRLFQHATVLENLCCVCENNSQEAIRILKKLGLSDTANMFPSELSGGMKRRVALARALLYDADIVLLDECFTGLDAATKELVAKVVNEYTKDKTVILISHSKEESRLLKCKIFSLENGFIS